MVQREVDAPAIVPEREPVIFQKIVEVVMEDLLPSHADRVAPVILDEDP